MTVTVARTTVQCPTCNHHRTVTDRHVRRARQQGGIRCLNCRGRNELRAEATEQGLRFWLRQYGAKPPKGMTARDYIVGGGAPPELVELARTLYPPPR